MLGIETKCCSYFILSQYISFWVRNSVCKSGLRKFDVNCTICTLQLYIEYSLSILRIQTLSVESEFSVKRQKTYTSTVQYF